MTIENKPLFNYGTYIYENDNGGSVIEIIRTTPKSIQYFVGKYYGSFDEIERLNFDNFEWLVPEYLLKKNGGFKKKNRNKIIHGQDTFYPDKATFYYDKCSIPKI